MHHDTIRVAIADDESMIRTGIQRLISMHGESWDVVGSFKNGRELLECCEQTNLQFDLLITDVKMPVVDGLTLIKELRRKRSFEAIVISGFDDFSFLQTAIREGVADYILKPIDREEFFVQLSKIEARIKEAKAAADSAGKGTFVMWNPSEEEQQRIHARKQQYADPEAIEKLIGQILLAVERLNREEVDRLLRHFFLYIETLASLKEIEKCVQSLYVQAVSVVLKDTTLYEDIDMGWNGSRLSTMAQLRSAVQDWLQKLVSQLEEGYKQRQTDPLALAKRWIQSHLHENVTIERVAKEVYMNATYFCEQFKNQTGETVLDYTTRLRMQRARELLLRTDMKVYEIAQSVGYTDTKYFSKLFKKHLGELPSQFKERKLQ